VPNPRIRITWFVLVSMLWILVFCSYIVFYSTGYAIFYWLGAVLSFGSFALTIMKTKRESCWLFSVLLFIVTQRTLLVLRLPSWGFSAFQLDASFNMQLSNLIKENANWAINMGTHYAAAYSYHPALHIWTAVFSDVSGLDPFSVARLFIFLSPMITLLFYYLCIRVVLTKKIAALSAFIYSLNETFVMFDHYVMESFALIFYSMCLYIFFRSYFRNIRSKWMVVIWILATFTTIYSHHWTSYNLLITLVILSVLPALYANFTKNSWNFRSKNRFPTQLVILGFLVIFAWILLVSYPMFEMHKTWFLEFFTNVSAGGKLHRASLQGRGVYEVAMIYSGQLFLIILGILQLRNMMFSREKKSKSTKSILLAWFIFCLIYMVGTTFFSPGAKAWSILSRRNWEFTFFGLSPLPAMFIHNNLRTIGSYRGFSYYLRRFTVLLLIFPLVSTFLLHAPYIRNPSFPIPSYSYYSSVLWVKGYMPNELIAVDSIYGPTMYAYGEKEQIGSRWIWGSIWPEKSQGIELIYQTEDVSLFQNILFNKDLQKWYPDIVPNSSLYDQNLNKIFDSSSASIFRQMETSTEA